MLTVLSVAGQLYSVPVSERQPLQTGEGHRAGANVELEHGVTVCQAESNKVAGFFVVLTVVQDDSCNKIVVSS